MMITDRALEIFEEKGRIKGKRIKDDPEYNAETREAIEVAIRLLEDQIEYEKDFKDKFFADIIVNVVIFGVNYIKMVNVPSIHSIMNDFLQRILEVVCDTFNKPKKEGK